MVYGCRLLPVVGLVCLLSLPVLAQEAQVRQLSEEERQKLFAHRTPPPDVAEVPDDATRTDSGLAFRVLTPGSSDERPGPNDLVSVHFSGWTTRGVLVESSLAENRPWNFQVNLSAPGLAEALVSMQVGEKRRLWVPAELATFEGRTPQGMLVYDLELLGISTAPTPPSGWTAPEKATRSDTGLAWQRIREGWGRQSPGPEDRVIVDYTLWTADGVIRASSQRRGEPETLEMRQMGGGTSEALQAMVPGERRWLWVPGELEEPGLDEDDQIWNLELIAVIKKPVTPPDVGAIPEDATRTESGLAYKVLEPGHGRLRPGPSDTVVINYATWTPDGKLIDSTFDRGRPLGVDFDGEMPAGLQETLAQMVEGERRRIWLPPELGFVGFSNVPESMLVFELDLVSIE